MVRLNKSDIAHVAKLAKLELSDSEVVKLGAQLSKVISYFEELNEIDTSNIEPTSQTTRSENITREDKVKEEDCLGQDNALSGSEEIHNGYFAVPMVLEERTDY